MAELTRKRVIVTGRVQGVFFRESTRKKAEELGLSGWVRNLEDGGVEWVAEGPPASVESLVRWCRAGGPLLARVDRVDILAPPEGALDAGFLVLR